MKLEDCPVEHVSLHSKLEELIKLGVLKEEPVYHSGFGQGKMITFNGVKIKIKRKIKGIPKWKNGVPEGLYFHESHDVAYCPVTSTLISWAMSI